MSLTKRFVFASLLLVGCAPTESTDADVDSDIDSDGELMADDVSSSTAALSAYYPVDHHISPDQKSIRFRVRFPHAPDFYATDSLGRVKDYFQFEIREVKETSGPVKRLFRGSEIRYSGSVLIRQGAPLSVDVNSGGWGRVVAVSRHSVDSNNVVSFAVPTSVLGTASKYYYTAFFGQYGGTTKSVERTIDLNQ